MWGPRGGAYDQKFELGRDFCTVHLSAKFHHPTFNRSEVIVLTNKQTDAAENIHLAPLRYVERPARWQRGVTKATGEVVKRRRMLATN